MGLFDRFRLSGRASGIGREIKPDTSDQDTSSLIDEGNAFEDAGRLEEAKQRYQAAIQLSPNLARAHLNYGNILLATDKAEAALEAYATALVLNPDYAAAHYNLGNANARVGRHEAALDAYRAALRLKPEFVDAEVALGCVQEDLGQFEEAAASYRRALEIRPGYAEVHGNLGSVLRNLGRFEDAAASYRRALEIKPDSAEMHLGLGSVLSEIGRHESALASFRRVLEIDPDSIVALINLGDAQRELGQPDAAAANYRRALELKPDFVMLIVKLGNVLRELGQHDGAVANYRRALEIDPDSVMALNNLGTALKELGQLDAAVGNYRRALEIEPGYAEAHSNLGIAQAELGQMDDAVASYRRALEIEPDYAEAHSNLGIALLEIGRFSEGWREYEYRWEGGKPKPLRPPSLLPQWTGQKLSPGDRLLVFVEQGMGDMLQFARYLPLAAECFSGGVSIVVGNPLRALFSRSFPMVDILDVVPTDQNDWQWQCPLLSLPLAFCTTLENIPNQVPYLRPDPARVAHWQAKIAKLGLPASSRRIGVVWKPGTAMKTAQLKAVTLQEIAPLLNQPSCAWFSLQKEPDPDKESWVASGKLIDWTEEFGDFNETASLAMNMDLIISVDTSVSHLAGGLGLPTWLLNRHASDWRWMLNREDSPWYPTIRIFRQTKAGDWSDVVSRMSVVLAGVAPQLV